MTIPQNIHNIHNIRSVNLPMILKVTGWLLLIEATFMLIPAVTALSYGEKDAWPFLFCVAATALCGVLMRCIRPRYKQMGRREGFLITSSVWIWFSLFGMLPFIFGSPHYSVSDAFFEAMSGFTTTGATIMKNHMQLSHGMNIWRAEMQWLGGMGIILFTLAVLPMLNSAGGMQMFNAEATGITHDKVHPRISSTAKALWGTYLALTILEIVCLWLGPMDLFESICYTFSSISTGGFSCTYRSLGDFASDYVYIILIIFMFLGGVNFALIFKAVTHNPKEIWKNEIFRIFIFTLLAFYILMVIEILRDTPLSGLTWQSLTIYPLFQVLATITSTGLDSGVWIWWSSFAIAISMVMMFVGSCAGSTSGGAKIDRMTFLLKHLSNELVRIIRPNAVLSVRVNKKVQSPTLVDKVTAFMCIYVLLIAVGCLALTMYDVPPIDALFDALSCVSNTGLSAEVTGMGTTFEILPDVTKWILSMLMLIGRLELFSVLVIFTRPFWSK